MSMSPDYQLIITSAGLFDLSPNGRVAVAGKDAAFFLHNVSTNDVKGLPVNAGCPAFLATAKAKFVAGVSIFHAKGDEDVYWLDTAPGNGPKVAQHLDRFLISEVAEIADCTGDFSQYHVAGPQAATLLGKLGTLPALEPWKQAEAVLAEVPATIRRLDRFALPGYDVLVPRARGAAVLAALQAAGVPLVSAATAEILRIEAGLPREGIDMDENNLVMEVGGAERAISFNKGCYLGQEPIVRARDLGHVNWAFRGLRVAGDRPVAVGSKLYREDKEVGRITSATHSPRLGSIALGYVRRGSHTPGTEVSIETATGRTTAVVSGLPFSCS